MLFKPDIQESLIYKYFFYFSKVFKTAGMDLQIVFNFFRSLNRDTLSFFYQGNFSDEITDKIINLSEYNISQQHEQPKMSNKVSFLMAECFQNIVRHGESVEGRVKVKTGLFITRHVGASYYITSANLIDNSNIDYLKEKLEKINQLDKDQLKQLYMDILENEGLSSKGGAGLGLVEMARKSGQKLDFYFSPIDEHFSHFYLQIKMKDPQMAGEDDFEIPITHANELHHLMQGKNILVIHKGDYSQVTVVPILRMLENNLRQDSQRFKVRKKTFHMLVEILQNISKHSYKSGNIHEGIFILSIEDGQYVISTGNFILNSEIKPLKERLLKLSRMSKEELSEMYKQTLKDGKITSGGGAGLGLIDIARESTRPMQWEFSAYDDMKSFFIFSAAIREKDMIPGNENQAAS